MPSLSDTLAHLHAQSHQIVSLSNANYKPPGPFVDAVLRSHDVLSLIRDADPSEARLFKFVGEETSGNKRVEKRDGGVVTPLKQLKTGTTAAGKTTEGKDNVRAILQTAMTLVDDYRPMPRARTHIQELIDAHQAQSERVAELERLIQEVIEGSSQPQPSSPTPKPTSQPPPRPALSVDEAIKAEAAALKRLEAHIAPHRPSLPSATSTTPAQRTGSIPNSPPPASAHPFAAPTPSRTPSAKTPNHIHIANSLVNGTTPRRPIQQPINRFSPLKLIGTPRTASRGHALRYGQEEAEDEDSIHPRTIFSRASMLRSSSSSLKRSVNSQRSLSSEKQMDEDETVRFGVLPPAVLPEPANLDAPASPDPMANDQTMTLEDEAVPQSSPVKETPPSPQVPKPKRVEGVEIESDLVKRSTDKIHSMWSDMLRQGLKPGEAAPEDPESIVKHLYKISRSDPDAATSDMASVSSLSTTAEPGKVSSPITTQSILLAHLFLLILRTPDGTVTMQASKDTLGSIVKARGWTFEDDFITKTIYAGVGKRVVKIDRKGGFGGRVFFAL